MDVTLAGVAGGIITQNDNRYNTMAINKPTDTASTDNSGENVVNKVTQKKPRPLTRKQKAFIAELVANPKQSATQAAKKTYGVTTENSARVQATRTLANANVQLELAKHSKQAEQVLAEVLGRSRQMMQRDDVARAVDWSVNARQTADSILDRIHGKATQRIEQTSQAVNINVDLSL